MVAGNLQSPCKWCTSVRRWTIGSRVLVLWKMYVTIVEARGDRGEREAKRVFQNPTLEPYLPKSTGYAYPKLLVDA